MKNKDLIKQTATILNIEEEVVSVVFKSFWEFIKDKIEDLPLKDDLTEEEFNTLRVNFNVPKLGKFTCSYKHLKGLSERYEFLKNRKK